MCRISRAGFGDSPAARRHRELAYPDVGGDCQSDDGLSLGTPKGGLQPAQLRGVPYPGISTGHSFEQSGVVRSQPTR